MYLNLAAVENESLVLGPGKRSVIWVQGCEFDCPNCINEHLQSFEVAELTAVKVLVERIIEQDVEGVTITGGEPFLQPQPLAVLAANLKKAGLTVQVYSGFYLKELLDSKHRHVYNFLDQIDVLIDGRYEVEKAESTLYKGSSNQNIYFFTDAYSIADYQDRNNSFELSYQKNKIRMVGFYDQKKFKK
ncbi:MAG: 4Fe-4S single cluster domain-containing protein [Bacillota bacterium]